jgi:hypothetical protein
MKSYAYQKEQTRQILARHRAAAREIAPIPSVVNRVRRRAAFRRFQTFCETYQSAIYRLPWSPDHLRMIGHLERAVREGTLVAFAMPRGSGKTSLSESAVLWAALTGKCEFAVLIGADQAAAEQNLQAIYAQLTTNDDLADDFPEVCYPLRKLEGIHQRRLTYNGEQIRYKLTHTRIIFPTIPGSKASAAIIQTTGLTGQIRGMKYSRPDGSTARPSLVLIDDPQSDESARSPTQCAARESILAGAVLGLAGPGRKIAGIMTVTVIAPGDLAERFLDRSKHPDWHGERTKLVYSFPSSPKWETYAELRAESLRAGGSGEPATEFYAANRAEMDEGAAVAWPQRHHSDELSAIQHAMNLRLRDPSAFASEYQNEPLPDPALAAEITVDEILRRATGRPRHAVPLEAANLTAVVDVQASLLYYVVVAWAADFTGSVVDYGTYPEQRRDYFTLRDARRTLAAAAPGAGLEGAVYAGLDQLTRALAAQGYIRDDGQELRIERILIDANWSVSTELVYTLARASPHAGLLIPAHGRFIGASSKPMHEWSRKPGDRRGLNWVIPAGDRRRRAARHVVFDSNFWKSFIHARLAVAMGDRGRIDLFGDRAQAHRMFAEHLTAEYRVKTAGRGRVVDEWKARPDRPDNHWLDCLAGAAVAASIGGAQLPGQPILAPRRRRFTFADARAAAARLADRSAR